MSSLLSLLFVLIVPATLFASAPQLICTHTNKGTQQQLAITPNALGLHDVSLHTPANDRQPQQIWLALRLTCTVNGSEGKLWNCNAAQHNNRSAHAHSALHSTLYNGDGKELESGKELAISITSPLLPEGIASYRFAHEQCTTQTHTTRDNFKHMPHSCQARFRGAFYDPDQGDCAEKAMSGCSNPFPYRSRTECRIALKL